ncbi:MAG TPA: hypothetical protein VHZ28_08645 [Terracidiphilus sp.]|nr:hypothetical protein [Terracidiphilus sp.]
MRRLLLIVLILSFASLCHSQMSMNMGGAAGSFADNVQRHDGSGTDLEPASGSPPMLMRMTGDGWMLMLHGNAMTVAQQQAGPRGHDKLFSVNWFMPMAQRSWGSNQLTLRTMFSLEPATISGRFYPELFQQGETAFGKPIVDGQHPHNLFMEIAALYDRKAGAHTFFSAYIAPVGDPSLGPEAFPHRPSASEDPLAPLGHHLQDSTHIAYDVVTGGVSFSHGRRGLRVEGSGFHGREPDENRWHIEVGAMDSWSARLSVAPANDWVAQYSLGRLHSPEALHSDEDVLRQTASLGYHHAWSSTSLHALAVWGRNHTIGSAEGANGYLAEATARVHDRHIAWARIENVDRTTDLLGSSAPPEESVVGRVQAYTGGYAHRLWGGSDGSMELGVQGTSYSTPSSLTPLYGKHPFGVAVIFKVQVGRGEK